MYQRILVKVLSRSNHIEIEVIILIPFLVNIECLQGRVSCEMFIMFVSNVLSLSRILVVRSYLAIMGVISYLSLVLLSCKSLVVSLSIYCKSCNHKRLGCYYLLVSLYTGFQGTYISIIMRIELDSSGIRIIPSETQNIYNLSITLHGLLMIFFLVMPGLFGGFGNILLPIYLGAPEVTYPRINNMSIIIIPLSYI